MGFKREDIRDTSPLSLKKLNDTLRYLWLHSFGNITFSDLNSDLKGNINSRVTKTEYDAKISEIQNQIDGVQYSWFYPYVPTLNNVPASQWTTDLLKDDHIGDTFTDTTVDGSGNSTGYSYRFIKSNGTYMWSRIADSTAAEALQKASKAQDTADSKRRVFTITPFVPYDIGDMWLQGSTGDILKCKTTKDSTGSYSSADWEFASKYTDDEYAKAVESALGTRILTVEQKVTDNALVTTVSSSTAWKDMNNLAMSQALGKMLYDDPTFTSSLNGISVYNNLGNGNVQVNRITRIADCPTASNYCIEVKTTGTAEPGNGGFYFGTMSRAKAVFLTRIIAKIPVGCSINFGSNSYGGGTYKWLTPTSGTGDWTEYILRVNCGNNGSYSTTNYFYINGATLPLTWYIAYATVFDLTDNDYMTPTKTSTIAQSPENVKIGFNGISDVIVATPTGLQVNHSDGSYSKLEATGLKKYISGTGKTYHYLTYVGSAVVPSTNDVITIQLPDEWKGKEFYATASLSAVNNWTTGYAMQTFAAFVESYDRPNGRFTIHGGMEVFHVNNPSGTHAKIDSQVSFTVVA